MNKEILNSAIDILADQFTKYDWTYHDISDGKNLEKAFKWFGPEEEDIMICVHKGYGIHEKFHRHDFFFFNYAYQGNYDALSYEYDNRITIHEGELCGGQPFTGYALVGNDENEKLMHFFIDPYRNKYSDEFLHLHPGTDSMIHSLLETMIVEYAYKKEDTQTILKTLTLALIMYTARQYAIENPRNIENRTIADIIRYISEHIGKVSLNEVAKRFSYHPNYLSSMLRKELGITFTKIVLKQRMERAAILLENTNLSVEEVAEMVGYENSSNFYKAFKNYYHSSPREQVRK